PFPDGVTGVAFIAMQSDQQRQSCGLFHWFLDEQLRLHSALDLREAMAANVNHFLEFRERTQIDQIGVLLQHTGTKPTTLVQRLAEDAHRLLPFADQCMEAKSPISDFIDVLWEVRSLFLNQLKRLHVRFGIIEFADLLM